MKLVVDGRTFDPAPGPDSALDIISATSVAGATSFVIRHEGRVHNGHLGRTPDGFRLWLRGRIVDLSRARPVTSTPGTASTVGGDRPSTLTAPYACRLVAVHVEAGRSISAGAPLFRIESMKMEHEVNAPSDGVVTEIRATAGVSLARGDVVMIVGPNVPDRTTNGSSAPSSSHPLAALHALLVEKKVIAPDLKLTPDMRLTEDVGIDSLAMVRLVGTVRERFGFAISARDMTKDNFATVGTLVAYLHRRLTAG